MDFILTKKGKQVSETLLIISDSISGRIRSEEEIEQRIHHHHEEVETGTSSVGLATPAATPTVVAMK
jgi:hypothetical protein